MKQLLTLTRLNTLNYFNLNRARHTSDSAERKKAWRQVLLFGFLIIYMMFMLTVGFISFTRVAEGAGGQALVLGLAVMGGSAASLFFMMLKAGAMLFAFKDFDALLSMPVKTGVVVASRVLLVYINGLFYSLFITLAAGIAYAVVVRPALWFYPAYLLVMLLTPLLPAVIASALSTLITRLTLNWKRKKIASSIFTMVLVLAILFFSNRSGKGVDFEALVESLTPALRGYFPANWCYLGFSGEIVYLLFFALLSLGAFVLFSLAVSRVFLAMNSKLTAQSRSSRAAAREKAAGPLRALYRSELRRYVATPIYFSNTALGTILLVAASAALLIAGKDKLMALMGLPGIDSSLMLALPFGLAFFISLSATTPASISIEGKRFRLLRSLPVATETIFDSKLLLDLTVILPGVIAAVAAIAIALKPTGLALAALVLAPLIYTAFFGLLGLWLNLCSIKLDWQNEAEVVKQGIPMMVQILIAMLLSIGPLVLMLTLGEQNESAAKAVAFALLSVLAVATVILYRLVFTRGKRKFESV